MASVQQQHQAQWEVELIAVLEQHERALTRELDEAVAAFLAHQQTQTPPRVDPVPPVVEIVPWVVELLVVWELEDRALDREMQDAEPSRG